jgi:hypothetical protein
MPSVLDKGRCRPAAEDTSATGVLQAIGFDRMVPEFEFRLQLVPDWRARRARPSYGRTERLRRDAPSTVWAAIGVNTHRRCLAPRDWN